MYTDKPTSTRIQPTNCVAYFRVSTDRQGRSGLGLEAQQQAVAHFLTTRGWTLAEEFIEVESGSRSNRPELAKALDACKQRKAILVVAKLDRLSRNVAFIANLLESGSEFCAVDFPEATRLTLHIMAAVAEHEREMISQRTKAALAAAKARGIELGANGKALARTHKAEATAFAQTLLPIIKAIRNDGHTTIRAVTAALNEQDILSREGGRWHLRSTALLLNRLRET